jgi:hypothetical protein
LSPMVPGDVAAQKPPDQPTQSGAQGVCKKRRLKLLRNIAIAHHERGLASS